jgi:MFS family permease
MGYLRNVKKLYIISYFHSLIPAYVIERLFWQQRGMNVQMVIYAEIIYSATVTLLEIPSGILSDKFGRKRLLCFYYALATAELALLLFAHSFWQFAAAIFLAGLGKALASGSENSLLYDSLQSESKQADFEKHLGRMSAIGFAGSIIAALSGGVIANFINLEYNYIISIGSKFAAFIITLSLIEAPIPAKPEKEMSGAAQYARNAWGVFKSQPLVFIYCLTGAVLGACWIHLDEFWQLILDNMGIPVIFFGVVGASISIIGIPGNLFAYKLKEKFKYKHILACIICFCIVGYASIFLADNLFRLIPVLLLFLVMGIVDPLIMGYLHHRAESHIRATAESFLSMGLRIVSAGVGLLFGYVSTNYSIFAGFLGLSAVCLIFLAAYGVYGKKHFRNEEK